MAVLNRADRHIRRDSDLTAPAEPDPRVSPQNRANRDCKPARAASAVAAGNRHTIGDHDQPGQQRPSNPTVNGPCVTHTHWSLDQEDGWRTLFASAPNCM